MDEIQLHLVRQAARDHAPDHYLSALLGPQSSRDDLLAIAAFVGDVDRIIATVSEPALAEIRLQWWRDAITGAAPGIRTGNPLADALGDVIIHRVVPIADFEAFLHARSHDLYADPVPDEAALGAYLDAADGAPLRLAARCIPAADPASPLIAATAQAYGRARLLRTYPRFSARGRTPFPGPPLDLARQIAHARDDLTLARVLWSNARPPDRLACLPLSLVAPYLAAVQRAGHDTARIAAESAPLMRVWRIWAGWALGRV